MNEELIARAERLEAFSLSDPSNAALLLDLACTYHSAGRHESALATLDKLSTADRAAGSALRGQALMALSRWDAAMALYESALLIDPDNAALHFNLGYAVLGAGGESTRAVEAFTRAAELEPGNARVARWQALALDEAGDPGAARTAAERAIQLAPDDRETLLTLSQLKLDQGDMAQALQAARRCTALHPAHPSGWALKGQIELMQLDPAAAAKSLRHALDVGADDNDTRLALAQASMMTGRIQHAGRLIDEVVAADPTDDAAWCMRGWACAAKDDLAGAKNALHEALKLAPDSADAWAALAGIHLAAQDRDAAAQTAQRALDLTPGHVLASMVQAELHKTGGEPLAAQEISAALLHATPFGAIGPNLEAVARQAAQSPLTKRLQRRMRRQAYQPQA
jgi:tetratricopeptide (TPR) repeat protein